MQRMIMASFGHCVINFNLHFFFFNFREVVFFSNSSMSRSFFKPILLALTVKNGRKQSKIVENSRKQSKTVENSRKQSKTDENRRKLSKTVKNCQKLSNTVKAINMFMQVN